MIWRNLLRRKTRTLLTLIGIAIGVAAVVAMGAMAEGFINAYTTVLTGSGADVIVAQGDAADIMLSAVDDTVGPQLAGMAGVDKVSGVIMGIVTTPDVPYFIVFGLDPAEFGMAHYQLVEGEPIRGTRQMILGRTAARSFKKKVGDYFKFLDVSFKIVGLYETGSAVEDWGAVITLKEAQEVFKKPRQVAYYQIKAKKPEMVNGIIQEVKRRFPKLMASRSASFMDQQQETQMFRAFGLIIGMLAVVAGGLGMMNTMLMSVYERTREIGVLRALGWRRQRVIGLILGEAFLLSCVGGLFGIGLGVMMMEGLMQVPAIASFLGEQVYTPGLFVQAMIVALCLGAAGGLYPAWRAAQLQPVEAMRYEGVSSQYRGPNLNPQSPISSLQSLLIHNLPRQRTRTILTALGIGVGVGLIVALGGIADGFIAQFSAMGSQGGELTLTEAKTSDIGLSAIDEKVGRWVATLPEVAHVSGLLIGVAQVPGTAYFLVMGLEPNSYMLRHYVITEGERLRHPREMILGKVAAQNLKKKVGDTIRLVGNVYRIVGIFETGVAYEDGSGVIALKEAQSILKRPNQVSAYGVKLKNPDQAEAVRRQIEARWPQVSVARSTEFAEKSNDMQVTRTMVWAISFISVLVGGVGTMNTMLMSVYERTREIGTLRALGWRRRRVVQMVLRESLVLSFLSGLVGIGMGVGLAWLIQMEPTLGFWFAATYSPGLLLLAIAVALILGGIGALYPAWRAANLSPVEALRYE